MFFILLLILVSIGLAIASARAGKRETKEEETAVYLAVGSAVAIFLALFPAASAGKGLWSACFAVLIANACICIPNLWFAKKKDLSEQIVRNKKWIRALTIGTAVVFLGEVFICNFGVFARGVIAPAKEKTLSLKEANVDGKAYDKDQIIVNSEKDVELTFPSVHSSVQTIYMDLSIGGASQQEVKIAYTDATNVASFRNEAQLHYIKDNELSKYITCSFFGDVGQMKFTIHAEDNTSVTLNGITLNAAIPFHLSWIRVISLILILSFILTLVYCPKMKEENAKSNVFRYAVYGITLFFAFWAIVLFLLRGPGNVMELLSDPDTNQMNQELVDAFSNGQVSLLEKPSKELLALDNPYDGSLRAADGVKASWDHLLYNGKYYSYYGIGTVLTLFLPYHLITGGYFSSLWATCLYSLLGILFLSLTYKEFVKRLFPKISNGMAICGLVIVQASSFIWYCITIGNFYELAQVSGFAFLIAGMYFLMRSGVVGKEKISRVQMSIATILLSISVLCRAALALYCIVALLFVYAGVKKILQQGEEQTFRANRKPVMTFLLAALMPFVCIGSIQMIYNYLRFGSIFDFGIEYTLTIYDYQHIQFQFPLVLIAIYNYLFTVPKVDMTFPFVKSNYVSLAVNGYYYKAGFSAAGLIFRAVPVLGYIFGPRAYKRAGKNRKLIATIVIAGCLVVPLIQMSLIWQYGYTPRYAVDFAWEMIFGAFVILFFLNDKVSKPVKKLFYIGFIVSALVAFIVNFDLTYEFVLDYAQKYHRVPLEIESKMLSFGRLFEFWNMM